MYGLVRHSDSGSRSMPIFMIFKMSSFIIVSRWSQKPYSTSREWSAHIRPLILHSRSRSPRNQMLHPLHVHCSSTFPQHVNRNEVLRVAWNPNPVFNEMWFLTIDPFIRISVFIAKLSERQYCWSVFEDFHSQEYIQFFDIHRCLFMRLHFSIGGYDYRRTARFRLSIHFSITQVLFADHVH